VKKLVVLKLGGELLEQPARMKMMARAIARMAETTPLVIVHGGGKEIDAALAQASIPKHQVDGLRITDEATLQVVVSVLAGSVNTRFVAALNAAGARAVGLTGADAGIAPVKKAKPHQATNGEVVDLGLVGEPLSVGSPKLIKTLVAEGFVPVVACIGAANDGRLYNVNADTLAGNLAGRLRAKRLVMAGATRGVLGAKGVTVPKLDREGIEALIGSGTATAGMVAKLRACRKAVHCNVRDVAIADGREPRRLTALVLGKAPRKGAWTRITK
jgi:acetylglutamate kinase